MEDQHDLTWLGQLQYQAGVVSRQQAFDAGFTAKAIEWRLHTGAWRRLHHGVYATFTGNLSREAKLWAAVLRVGAGAVLSHETADGVHSPLERRYVHGVERSHGLPPARRQARRRHGSGTRYLDNLYEEYGLCVELDGNAAHPDEGRWRDTRRDNVNLVQGARTLRYGWPDVTEHRCRTAAEIAAVLRGQGWTGTPRRCGPSCTAAGTRGPRKVQKPQKRPG